MVGPEQRRISGLPVNARYHRGGVRVCVCVCACVFVVVVGWFDAAMTSKKKYERASKSLIISSTSKKKLNERGD